MTSRTRSQLIGLMADESSRLLVGLMGILKSGHAFVPIDPTYPAERADFIIADCRIEILVTEFKYIEQALQRSERSTSLRAVICLDEDCDPGDDVFPGEQRSMRVYRFDDSRSMAAEKGDEAEADVLPQEPAYVIYTSGSTGQPKGVPITHENLFPLLTWSRDYFGFGEHTKVLQNLSYCFDFGVFELLSTILFGGTIYFPDTLRENARWGYADFVNAHGINTIHSTPTAFREIIAPGGKLESLEVLHLGGEQLTKNGVEEIFERVGEACVLFNGYGPTEATINCAIFKLGNVADTTHRSAVNIPIGRPSANNTLFILDRHHQLTPIGAPGELYVGGAGLALGYLNRPDLSGDKFIPNPFSNEPGARLYKTGDLVRFLPDGNLEFLGRVDNQVKLSGYRIELGEIETALHAHPSIRECAVLVREDAAGDKRLVAYATCLPEQETKASELRIFLKQSLPAYMVPSAFVLLEALPITPNGKLDRRALPAPERISFGGDEDYVAPATPTEEVVANVCSEVLSLDRLGRHENLFEVGCHSLLATKIVSRLRDTCQSELSLLHVFQSPTVAGLAQAVETNRGAEPYLEAPRLRRFARDGHAPLSFSQERLWFLSQMDPTSTSYFVPRALRIKGRLEVKALQDTFSEIIRRHEILRTTFPVIDGTALQLIHLPQPTDMSVLDLSSLAEEAQEEELRQLILEEGRRPFDLERGPLLRLKLVSCSAEHHVLLLTEQHLIHDGWTQGVLIRELLAIYTAFSAGEPSPLPELDIQYADFTLWQRQWLQGEVMERLLSYWKNQLAGAAPFLPVPTDRSRPAAQTYRGAQLTFDIPTPLAEALRALSRREGATLFMVLLAAFKALLFRYTGQADISVGTGIANRRWREIESLIGMVINTVVLRTQLDGNPTFRELVRRVREVCLGGYAHQDLPFGKLVEELHPERDPSYSPLFQVMFALHDAPEQSLELPGLDLSLIESHNQSAKFDLTVIMIPHYEQAVGVGERIADGSITTLFEYNADLFDGETIARMWRHYLNILEAVAGDAASRLTDLPLLSGDERELLLRSWNQTAMPVQLSAPLHHLVRQHASRAPDSLAVSAPPFSLTYLQLDRAAARLAGILRRRGAAPDRLVAILLDRSAYAVVSQLAAFHSSAAYLPLDPGFPPERLRLMLEDSAPVALLTRTELLEKLPAPWSDSALLIDELWPELTSELVGPADVLSETVAELDHSDPEQLAYVIYTSGSTGTPRAVAVTHRGLSNLVDWHLRSYDISPSDRASLLAGVAFDASVWELWPHLAAGASLHVPEPEVVHSSAALAQWLIEQQITRSFVPTPLAEVLCAENLTGAKLQTLLTGGDRLRRGGPAEWSFSFINHYGPTESTVVATSGPVPTGVEVPSIGKPIANTRVYVLDGEMQVAPLGVTGELYIGGDGLARGYLNRAALTAEFFVPDPFAETPGGRLYRTGDLVRYRSDGNLEYVGRIDQQVKLRGFRIELGEVEAALLAHPHVRECVVLAREDDLGDKRLVAYVVAVDQAMVAAELRAHLRERLPDYMLPASFVALERLPLTPNGKLDRQALPAPAFSPSSAAEYEPPRSATEELLAFSFADLLQVDRVSRTASFFDLGGHSLLATQVVSRIRRSLGVELPLRLIFEEPTVAALAIRVEERRAESLGSMAAPAWRRVERATRPQGQDEQWPLSYAQQRLWYLEQLEPGNAAYNIPAAVRLSGDLDLEALERALTEIARRHETLRTTFTLTGGEPCQQIAPPRSVSIPMTDLSRLAEPEAETEVARLSKEEASRGFALEQSAPWRLRLLKLSAEEHVLVIVMHHIISDGWSAGVLTREVAALYRGYRGEREYRGEGGVELAELDVQYRDYAVWQRAWLSGGELERQLSYWREQLAGAPEAMDLPADRPRPTVQSYRGAALSFSLDGELSAGLRRLARGEEVTPFMLLLAAFQALLFRYTGQEDVVVGTPVAGRTRAEVEALIGFFINTLVLRTQLTGRESFRGLVRRVKEICLAAYAHQDVPFERVVEELQPGRDSSRTPLFQVMFTMRDDVKVELRLPGLSASAVALETGIAKFDLTMTLLETEGGLSGKLEYNTDLFERSTIERMIGHYKNLLAGVSDNPEQSLANLPLMDETQRQQLSGWNDTTRPYPRDLCIHELFELAAQRSPDAVALVHETEQLTYDDLNRRANQLAHYLRKLGVGPETLVGICVERSIEMIVGLLGILKAGGAYLPIDATYPEARILFMLEDARIPLLLTQAQLRNSLPPHGATVVDLDADREFIGQESIENPTSNVGAENLAYVMYTSGSTGRPKGTSVTHRNVVRLVKETNYLQFSDAEVFLQLAPISFDASTFEIWGPLLNGARLVVYPATTSLTLEELGGIIEAQGITTLWLTAGLFHRMVDYNLDGFKSLRHLLAGGEALSPPHVKKALQQLAGCRVINGYGPTENTTFTCCYSMTNPEQPGVSVPIGKPITNTKVYVLDAEMRMVPLGVTGELYIGGDGLARGYLNRAALTAERFVPNPFSEEPGGRFLRSGDLVRYLSSGNLEFLGRADQQVKIRGFRIELGEVEAALQDHPGVQQAVVTVGEGGGEKRLVAYVVAAPPEAQGALDERRTMSALRAHLKERLPDYMLPSSFVFLDELPLTSNGKLDRRALPAPDSSQLVENQFVAPRNVRQEMLCAMWTELLPIERVGIHDNFFMLGGHSLLAINVISRVREVFAREVSIRSFLEEPTIAALSELLENEDAPGSAQAVQAITPAPRALRRVKLSSLVEGRTLPAAQSRAER